jgi:hypothetical protein
MRVLQSFTEFLHSSPAVGSKMAGNCSGGFESIARSSFTGLASGCGLILCTL